MYSALYVADCQGKRLLILAITIAEGNPDVKNISYLPPRTLQKGDLPGPGAAITERFVRYRIPGYDRSFPKMAKFGMEIRPGSGYDQLASGSTAPDEMGRFPQIVFQKNRLSKIRDSDALR